MTEIKVGDVVTLKSDSSYKMTVGEAVEGTTGLFVCFYFYNGEIKKVQVPATVLIAY